MSAAPKIRIFESDVQPVRIDELKIDEKVMQSRAETDPEIVQAYSDRAPDGQLPPGADRLSTAEVQQRRPIRP